MLQVLKTQFKGRGKHTFTAEQFAKIGRVVNGMVGFDGIEIEAEGEEIRFFFRGNRGSSGARYARPFQILAVGAGTIDTAGGVILHGSRKIVVAPATVAVAGGTYAAPTFCVLRYDFATGASILPTTVTDFPLPTQGPGGMSAWQQPLWSAYRDGASVRVRMVLWDSMVVLPGVFAP